MDYDRADSLKAPYGLVIGSRWNQLGLQLHAKSQVQTRSWELYIILCPLLLHEVLVVLLIISGFRKKVCPSK